MQTRLFLFNGIKLTTKIAQFEIPTLYLETNGTKTINSFWILVNKILVIHEIKTVILINPELCKYRRLNLVPLIYFSECMRLNILSSTSYFPSIMYIKFLGSPSQFQVSNPKQRLCTCRNEIHPTLVPYKSSCTQWIRMLLISFLQQTFLHNMLVKF